MNSIQPEQQQTIGCGCKINFMQIQRHLQENEHRSFCILIQLWPWMNVKVINTNWILKLSGVPNCTEFERNWSVSVWTKPVLQFSFQTKQPKYSSDYNLKLAGPHKMRIKLNSIWNTIPIHWIFSEINVTDIVAFSHRWPWMKVKTT